MDKIESNIPNILQKMTQVCPVSCFVVVLMDSEHPEYITLRWRWKIKKRPFQYSIRILLFEFFTARINIIQAYILPLKYANWQNGDLVDDKQI